MSKWIDSLVSSLWTFGAVGFGMWSWSWVSGGEPPTLAMASLSGVVAAAVLWLLARGLEIVRRGV